MTASNVDQLRFARAWLEAETEAGRQHGQDLLGLPTAMWRSEIERDANLQRYGTLRFVLETIRDDLFDNPMRARERAAIIVKYAARVDVPLLEYRAGLTGLAWKEYANALTCVGEFADALEAARHSQKIYGEFGSLACEAAKARLVEALVHRELGKLDLVLTMARECAEVFRDHQDAEAYVYAQMTRALALSDAKRTKEAMGIFSEIAADAEKRNDRRTMAMCLHNSAECARALGDRSTARMLDKRALALFVELGTTVEKPRIRWTEALALVAEGRVGNGIMELRTVRAEFLELGMNAAAAAAGLDVVRVRYEQGESVISECVELVETLANAGMIQSAIEALAYLREQARLGRISNSKIDAVRDYVLGCRLEANAAPRRPFAPPPDDDGGGP